MNLANHMVPPISSFEVDVPAGQYYDFKLPEGSTYPLAGVTYPVDYGHIPGYTAEDGHELDLFAGTRIAGYMGSISVFRGEDNPVERKFYVALTERQLNAILSELEPVLVDHRPISGIREALEAINTYKDKE